MIEDNGAGFDAERVIKGVGLDSMKERLAAVKGELDISNPQPSGTRLIARVKRS
jgi:signal transduction histidine kinase